MGETCSILSCLDASNWIDIAGTVVNAGLAYWIVRAIQDRLTNRRILKDHFIEEVKEIRSEYMTFMNSLYTDNMIAKQVIPWTKLMNIKVNDLVAIISKRYNINNSHFKPYQRALQELITNNDDFTNQFNSPTPIIFSERSKKLLLKFQQENNRLFNEAIISINDAR